MAMFGIAKQVFGDELGARLDRLNAALEDLGAVLEEAAKQKMKKNRKTDDVHKLMSGPGKLCQAMGITRNHNDLDLHKPIKLFHHKSYADAEVGVSGRIGISKGKELPWRFYVKDSKFVSKVKL